MKKVLTCKDYTVSGEKFSLFYDANYEMLLTQPKPDIEKLPFYYQSEQYISHTDSRRTIFDKVYQLAKNINLKNKIKLLNSFSLSGKKLLDVGCGTGSFLQIAEKHGWDVVGVEPNVKAQQIAKTKLAFNVSLFSDLDFVDNSVYNNTFDVITLWHVLEHVPDLHTYISQLQKLLNPNGILVIAIPNYKSYDAAYYKEFWAAYDVPRHLWHFSKLSIKKLFSEHNMQCTDILPMKFDAYYVSLLSEKYKNGKQKPLAAFRTGFISNRKAKHSGEYSSLIYLLKNI